MKKYIKPLIFYEDIEPNHFMVESTTHEMEAKQGDFNLDEPINSNDNNQSDAFEYHFDFEE